MGEQRPVVIASLLDYLCGGLSVGSLSRGWMAGRKSSKPHDPVVSGRACCVRQKRCCSSSCIRVTSFVSDARPELTVRFLTGLNSSSEALVSWVGCFWPFPLPEQTCSYTPFDGINLVRPNLPKTKS